MTGEEFIATDISDNHAMAPKAKSILIQSLATEKKQLAKGKSPYGILQAVRNDFTQRSGIAQINQLRIIQELRFEGPGKMKQYLEEFEKAVQKLKYAGGTFSDDQMIITVGKELMTRSMSYAHIIDSERKFDMVKGRLINMDMMMTGQKEGKVEESANKAQ
jgi:hypothetical protein